MCENFGIKSNGNTMFTNRQAKIVLNYFYVKRKVLRDGVSTDLLDLVLKPAEITTSSGSPDRVLNSSFFKRISNARLKGYFIDILKVAFILNAPVS